MITRLLPSLKWSLFQTESGKKNPEVSGQQDYLFVIKIADISTWVCAVVFPGQTESEPHGLSRAEKRPSVSMNTRSCCLHTACCSQVPKHSRAGRIHLKETYLFCHSKMYSPQTTVTLWETPHSLNSLILSNRSFISWIMPFWCGSAVVL